jgi:hypothetical protein
LAKNRRQSVVKTIRLTEELNNFLNEEARKTNQTVSALASSIIASYKDRYSYVDRLHPVAILPATLGLFLEHVDDEHIVKLGPVIASKILMYNAHVLGNKKNLEGLDWCISSLLPAAHWFNCFRSDEAYMITHQIGKKWGLFLSSFLSSLVDLHIGIKPDIQLEGDVVILSLPQENVVKKSNKLAEMF